MKQTSISMLVRWREFREACASSEVQRRFVEARAVGARVDEARAVMATTEASRGDLLRSSHLDIGVLQVAADIESETLRALVTVQAEYTSASQRQTEAQAQHITERAKTRVAEIRCLRVDKTLRERAEKIEFDWMVDLHLQTKGKK